ncbi:MAG: HAMP domain-containing sensor histidine kinase [Bacteroidota bacterium]
MKNSFSRIGQSLLWRISLIFFAVLVVITGCFLLIFSDTAKMYQQESAQDLNRGVAHRIAKENYLFEDSTGLAERRDELFHDVMVLNPSLEVYVVDTTGKIFDYNAPDSLILRKRIALEPVRAFLGDTTEAFFAGDNPRHPPVQSPFSAAEVRKDGILKGYVYVVLQSDAYNSVTERLTGSYMLGLGVRSIFLVLLMALAIGLLMVFLLTRNLRAIVRGVRRFRNGDYSARIELRSRGELTHLAADFNDMADTTVQHLEEIKSVEKLRRELIANVSHDLRTPLASIQGYAETLVMKSDLAPEARSRYAGVILKSTERIRKLVEDLFEFSKLEANQVTADFAYFSLADLVSDVGLKYALLAEKKGVELRTDIPKQAPDIFADLAMIDRVLQNLIDNAINHTEAGGTITISMIQEKQGMRVCVADTGLGIPEDDLPYIFDRYRRAGRRKKGGTGLGLAIVKKIVELHDSSVFVASRPNEGSEFWFHLPVQA